MSVYNDYLDEIETRRQQGLNPKPIEDAALIKEIISHIEDEGSTQHKSCLEFFIYNTIPGTTSAAGEKASFLKKIILGDAKVRELPENLAFELLSHMKGGPSVDVLLDLALGNDETIARKASEVLKTQVFLYEADLDLSLIHI